MSVEGIKKCWACRGKYPNVLMHTHHRTPRGAGGSDVQKNLVKICPECHMCVHTAGRFLGQGKVGQAQDTILMLVRGDHAWGLKLQQLAKEESAGWKLGEKSDEQLVTFTLARGTYEALKAIAELHKKPKQRGGVGKLLQSIIEGWFKSYLQKERGYKECKKIQKPIKIKSRRNTWQKSI